MTKNDSIVVSPYLEEDRDKIQAFVIDVQLSEYGKHGDRAELADLLAIPKVYQQYPPGGFWTAKYNGTIVGTIALKHAGSDAGMLKRFYVAQPFRRSEPYGTASKLLHAVLDRTNCSSAGYKLFLGTTMEPPAASKFFIKNGFVETDRESVPKGCPISSHDTHFFVKYDVAS